MSFNRSGSRLIHLKRARIREIYKAVKELEDRGYECVKPIKKYYFCGKKFNDEPHLLNGITYVKKKHFIDSYETVYYEVYMKKVE